MANGVYDAQRRTKGSGVTKHSPLRTRASNVSGTDNIVDEVVGHNNRARIDRVWDFFGAKPEYSLPVVTGQIGTGSGSQVAYVVVPRTGYLVAADFVGEDALATSDTDYVTFAITNRVKGSGSTAMLAASDANTTKATGGSAIAAKTARSLTVHGTAANLRVNQGDVLEISFTNTVATALANVVDDTAVTLRIATLDLDLSPIAVKTAGVVLVGAEDDTDNGEIKCALDATDEVQIAGISFGDQLLLDAAKSPLLEFRVKISGVAANCRFFWGLTSAYNATFGSMDRIAAFRVEGNDLTLQTESDDGTTDTAPADTTEDLTADTYFTGMIDLRDLGKIRFWHNNTQVAELDASDMSGNLQPFLAVQKDSGTSAPSFTLDYLRASVDRV